MKTICCLEETAQKIALQCRNTLSYCFLKFRILKCKFRGSSGLVKVNVQFQIAELPNDTKMNSFLSGELSNSAKYFSSFANVSTDDATVNDGTFGNKANSTWQPWKYSSRLTAVKKVDALKRKLAKQQLTNNTKRSKISALIASMKSRQEFLPPLKVGYSRFCACAIGLL